MSLRAIKPEAIEKRLKAFLYGAAGTGKTTFCASFPQAYYIDTEKGCENQQYIDLLIKNGSSVFRTNDFDELMKEVISLLSCKHDYKTLVIDSITTIHNDLIDKMSLKHGTDYGKHFSESNKAMKHLCNLLMRLDMNILISSHAKNEYGSNMAVLGQTYDAYKKLDYIFDLVFEVQKRGSERYAVTKKSRVTSIPDGESFLFSYDEIANRYGKEILLRDAVPQELATETQLEDLILLMNKHKIPAELRQKWLDKSNSNDFNEMPRETVQKLIDYLISKQTKE
jgi:KaiC/GvpD/RAD55 family RecA-like ATPase